MVQLDGQFPFQVEVDPIDREDPLLVKLVLDQGMEKVGVSIKPQKVKVVNVRSFFLTFFYHRIFYSTICFNIARFRSFCPKVLFFVI